MLVEARVAGQRGSALEPREVEYTPPAPQVALRELITYVVRAEVAAYDDRERRRRLVRVLSPDEIAAGVATGKVDSGGRETTGPADADAAVATALESFGDGLYLVFVDDRQVEDLEAAVEVRPDTRVRFVRLTALAGG